MRLGISASTFATAALLLSLTACCWFSKTSGAPYAKRHFITAQCSNDYWDAVAIAAQGTLDFDSYNCNTEATMGGIIDGILADMPPPESGEKVALVAGFSHGVSGGVEHLARAALAGVHLFFVEDEPDMKPYGFDESKHMALRFLPDNPQGARFTGQELCRLAGASVQRVAVIYGANPDLDLRIDVALEEFRKVCPSSRMDVAFKVRGDWNAPNASAIFETIFLVDSTLTTVLAANDGMALGVLEAADNVYAPLNARALLISGFDNRASIRPFLNSKRVFSTVDQLTIQPNLGMWNTIPKVMSVIESQGMETTIEVQMRLGLDTPLLKTDVGPVSADAEGYLIDTLDAKYQATVRASPDTSMTSDSAATEVEVGLFDVRLQLIDSAEGSFDATLWLQLSWVDARLAWPAETYGGTLQRSPGSLWEPFVYLANIQSSEADSLISETSSTVSSNGRVTKAYKYMCTLGCNMNVQPFPFDIHPCFINVTVGSDAKFVTLKAMASGMTVADMPEAYEHELGPALVSRTVETPTGLLQAMVAFEFFIVHTADYEHTTFIMVAWALNMVSFGQFWISPNLGNMDRAGLAVTTILASTVLQADARSSKITTWLDIFFSISIAFQFLTFFMSVMTAHYVFDPDYESEDILVEQLMESQRQKLKSKSEQTLVLSPTTKKRETKARKKEMNTLKYKLQQYLTFTDSVFGDERDIAPDRWGRRYVFPLFLVISAGLPFFPRTGNMNITKHPQSGVNSGLFVISITFLLGWFGILISRFAVVAFLKKIEDREYFPESSGGATPMRQVDATKVQFSGIELEQSPPIAAPPCCGDDNVA